MTPAQETADEALASPASPELPKQPRAIRPGVRMTVRGRSILLSGLRKPATGPLLLLAVLGPGLIAGTAGDDAGGIATYSQVGAKYGYDLLWVMLIITISLGVVQEMCARLGAASGRGLVDLIRERFGIAWALFAVAVVLIANGSILVTEFVGIGSALGLFGVSPYLTIPISAALVGYLVIAGSYVRVEKLFLIMALAFLAYPISAILARPDWGAVAHGLVVPTLRSDPAFLVLLVATIGTTISPYQQVFQQSAVVERGSARRHYGSERADTYFGAIISNAISIFIIIAAAATLHKAGKTNLNTAADAAQALAPIAGAATEVIFAIGILGASLLAAGVLPLATSYAISEAFGFRKGVNLDFRRAPIFLGTYAVLIAVAAAAAMLAPTGAVIQFLVYVQLLNGILLPVILIFLMLLINDRRIVGDLGNGRVYNVLGWGTVALIAIAVVAGAGAQILSWFGFGPTGS